MIITEPLIGFPCYAELTTPDPSAAAAFYGGLLGWAADIGTGRFLLEEAVVAGFAPATRRPAGWTVAIGVEDADLAARAVREAGGTVLTEPVDVADQGRTALVADPAGAVFSLWQARSFPGSERIFEDGALVWSELATGDPDAAPAWLLYFGTSDVDASVERAGELGAAVLVLPADIAGTGRFAVLRDPLGAAFALYAQPEAT